MSHIDCRHYSITLYQMLPKPASPQVVLGKNFLYSMFPARQFYVMIKIATSQILINPTPISKILIPISSNPVWNVDVLKENLMKIFIASSFMIQ
jgi:hypothetical protein